MNTDGNTAAIERMMAEREEHDERRELLEKCEQLADELNQAIADRDQARTHAESLEVELRQALADLDEMTAHIRVDSA